MKPRIVFKFRRVGILSFPITKEGLTIGRDEDIEVTLDDSGVSRRHCHIQFVDGHSLLTDLDSRNGTFVNGFCFPTKILVERDSVRMGGVQGVYLESEEIDDASLEISGFDSRSGTMPTEFALAYEAARVVILEAFLDITSAINQVRSSEEVQRRIFELIFRVIPAQSAAILLTGENPGRIVSRFYRSIAPESSDPFPLDEERIQAALQPDRESSGYQERILCRPLKTFDRNIGVLYVVTPSAIPITSNHGYEELLSSIAGLSAVALEHVRFVQWLEGENRRLQESAASEHGMIGESGCMKDLFALIDKAGPADTSVLITGESGSGKELVARAVHQCSVRSTRPYVAINCGAFIDAPIESELFGHEKGAFTGAVGQRKGLFEVADGGTIFLDEIGELSLLAQAAILRLLQEGEIKRVGSNQVIRVDVRVIAATNRDLRLAIRDGRFREDLFFRLNVIEVKVPSLAERRDDIPLLASHFIKKYANRRPVSGITPEAHRLLATYSWPGNVRELENAMLRGISVGSGAYIGIEDLPETLRDPNAGPVQIGSDEAEVAAFRKALFERTLRETKGNRVQAAKILGLHPTYFYKVCKDLGVKAP